MKSFGTRYTPRFTRTATAPAVMKHLPAIIKRGIVALILIVIFAYSINMMMKGFASLGALRLPSIAIPKIAMFSQEKYLIESGHNYIAYSNGVIKIAEKNIDDHYMVRLSGIAVDEKRAEYLKVYKQAINIDSNYLKEISEINLRNPKNIMMITQNGQIVYFGETISQEKMEYFDMSLNEMRKTSKSFKTMDLRYKDMAIIK